MKCPSCKRLHYRKFTLMAAADVPSTSSVPVYELTNVGKTYARNQVVASIVPHQSGYRRDEAFATAIDTASMAFAPSFALFGVPSRSSMHLSTAF